MQIGKQPSQHTQRKFVRRSLIVWFFVMCGLCISGRVTANETTTDQELLSATLTLPNPTGRSRPNTYIQRLIGEALKTQGIDVSFEYYELPSNQIRLNKLLQEGKTIDLAWLPADSYRTQKLQYVPIPLYQGKHGRRLFLIEEEAQPRFEKISTLSELANLLALQQRSWSDYKVLIENGLRVNGELNYRSMLRALSEGKGDYFPRSALTIFAEQKRANDMGIVIEKRLMLEYPTFTLLFLSQKQPLLMLDLLSGFQTLLITGGFEEIFQDFYSQRFESLGLEKRHRILLKNTELSEEVIELLQRHIVVQ